MDRAKPPTPHEATPPEPGTTGDPNREGGSSDQERNPPHTTKHGVTAPKFGSAGSGGAELEPGPETD